VNGSAGIVGNLMAESALLPNRIEGSKPETPMRARDFSGRLVDFTPQHVMDRDPSTQRGPRFPGIGIAQWTSAGRRRGLFQHLFDGKPLGVAILNNLDAQVDYLVSELRGRAAVNEVLTAPGVTVDDATDEVVYSVETPGAVLDGHGHRRPRNDPVVQEVFRRRRAEARQALSVFRAVHP
jgi:hypothetical protein